MALEITKAAIEDGEGVVWIEAETMEEVLNPLARKMAYEKRVEMGLSEAGLDVKEVQALDIEGNIIEDGSAAVSPERYRRIFILRPSPI